MKDWACWADSRQYVERVLGDLRTLAAWYRVWQEPAMARLLEHDRQVVVERLQSLDGTFRPGRATRVVWGPGAVRVPTTAMRRVVDWYRGRDRAMADRIEADMGRALDLARVVESERAGTPIRVVGVA